MHGLAEIRFMATSFVCRLVEVTQMFGEVEFVLCIGDDRSDEDMFEAVNLVDPTDGAESERSTTDDSSENDDNGLARLKARSELTLPRRQSSGKLSGGLFGSCFTAWS